MGLWCSVSQRKPGGSHTRLVLRASEQQSAAESRGRTRMAGWERLMEWHIEQYQMQHQAYRSTAHIESLRSTQVNQQV